MALELKLKQVTEGLNIRIIDDTDSSDSPYGGMNPERNTLKLFLATLHFSTEGVQRLSVVEYDPLTVESFYINNVLDGYKRYYMIAIDISVNIVADEDVYDLLDTVDFETLIGGTIEINGVNYDYYSTKLYCFPTPNIDKAYLDVAKEYFLKCNTCNDDAQVLYLRALRDDMFHSRVTAINNFRNNTYMVGQKIVELAARHIQKYYRDRV
jgi:hypothetical protein